mmetsp:Transcript_19736/g.29298  ORF Transcript_19736/g.29298 Transcript_19736/m.29298 type:complete len:725 (+) Transcript_19736:91-2265(+)
MSPLDPSSTPQPVLTNVGADQPSSDQSKSFYDFPRRFDLAPCENPPREELKPIIDFIQSSVRDPSSHAYRSMIECVRIRDDAVMFYRLLIVLRINGPILHEITTSPKKHGQLLHAIFRLDPMVIPMRLQGNSTYRSLVESYKLTDAYFHLVIAIISSNSTFLIPGLTALWKLIILHSSKMEIQGEIVTEAMKKKRLTYAHATIANVLRLAPRATVELQSIIAANFPFRSAPNITDYVQQSLLVVQGYAPLLESEILGIIVDKALEMDVEIKIKDDGDVEIDNEKINRQNEDAIFEMDLEKGPETPSVANEVSKEATEKKIDDMVERLDSLMLLLFEHIKTRLLNDEISASTLFRIVIPIFESIILTTYRSKYVQFIVLYLCGLSQEDELYREFSGYLVEVILDPNRATVIRQSAACYLASFISRATYVCSETACEAVSALLRWAEAYIGALERNENKINDFTSSCELHSLFFTVCQASFYIMCFRGAEAIKHYRCAAEYFAKNPEPADECSYADLDLIDMSSKRWERICSYELKPLRFCLESVREEFLHVANVFSLLNKDLLSILDTEAQRQSSGYTRSGKAARRRGKRINTPALSATRRMTEGVGGLGRGSNPLDSFFPFDPYLLRKSHDFIAPMYRNWDGRIDNDFAEDEATFDSTMEEEGQEDEDDEDSCGENDPAGIEPMSYNSSASSPSISEHRKFQQVVWNDLTKRPRAPSIAESGSW